ncbi:D-alanyl-D-alanine carboxypeptidase family protein [Amycolatopsis sp. H20-H5]|uniref:D-alanyl-D-alanine carboxypeptidase family protein n=1 Tax=Amycolatopsis sp. H20-H5 TaxID=3046309 RepID=UPI002DB7F4FC|nr:D-alanyl-D-alanine carboxypeptidase family protein [Amycolatopsis sp. H20-H5]MEC3981324.1 D-alanyl-D-alanine carboxypeptidase family protein [Amycolatopsis sp. H20-H5]
MIASGNRRTVIGVLLTLTLAIAVLAGLGATGRLTLIHEPVPGQAAAVVDEVPGEETGPVCPLDKRYVDEKPEGLRQDVLAGFTRLREAAGKQGVRLCVEDSKRSRGQQQREFDSAVKRFGSKDQASRYVLSPDQSMHVKGIAVDVQPLASAAWVETNGRALGWCRRYQNEKWHFEYDTNYVTGGCPALLPSATGF